MTSWRIQRRFGQRGTTAVEFAVVAVFFVMVVLGILELGWILFRFNSVVQATRHGARVAIVSAPYAAAIVSEMKYFVDDLTDSNVVICYGPNVQAPEYVVVRLAKENESAGDPGCDCDCNIQGRATEPYRAWLPPLLWPIPPIVVPPFPTALPREGLGGG